MTPVGFRLIGTLRVSVDGLSLDDADVGSRKGRRLLQMLVVERGGFVTTGRIIEALWGDDPPERPASNVATLVSRLRRALGASIIRGGPAGYALAYTADVRVDVDEAERLAAQAEACLGPAPALAVTAARKALDLLGEGALLPDEPDADWAEAARASAHRLLRRVRLLAAEAALSVGEPADAAEMAGQALAADPLDEVAARALMRSHQAAGQPAAALAAYERLRAVLVADLGTDPAPETRDVHLAVLREQEVELVTREALRPPRSSAAKAVLAGREAEVAALRRAWTAATEGHPALLLVTGEAGIGKTRLTEEVARLAEETGGEVLTARCYEAERSLFLQPVVDALTAEAQRISPAVLRDIAGERAGLLAALVPEVASVLGPFNADRGTVEVERRRTFDAVTIFLKRLSERRPALLLIDDLHNASLSVLELLHYLRRQAAGSRLLVVATVRTEEGAEALSRLTDVATRIDVGPLPADAVAGLAQAAGHGGHAEAILRRTGGHTLYVVETLRGLTSGELQVAGTLQEVVLARVRRAGAEIERMLRAAAVLGSPFEPTMVARLLDLPPGEAVRTCEDLLRLRLVVVAGRAYEFAHDLVREVLYATTPAPTRLAYHERAAALLADQPEAMAAHAAAFGDLGRAARGWLRAAEEAMQRFAAADAELLLDRAIAAATEAGDLEVRGRAHLARGRAREALASYEAAVADHEVAVGLARDSGDARLEMLALRELGGDTAAALGLPTEACIAPIEAGLRIAESLGDRGIQADLLSRLAVLNCNQLRLRDGVEMGRRAITVARATSDPVALAMALDGAKTGFAYLGEVAELEPILAELEPLLRRAGDLFRLQWTVFESSFPFIAAADWPSAAHYIEAALALNRRSGYLSYEGWFTAHLGWVARQQGRYDDAVGHGRRAVAASKNVGHAWWVSTAAAMLATTLLERGEHAAAADVLADTPSGGQHSGTEAYRLRHLAALAEATGSSAALDEADRLLNGIDAPAGCAWLLGADAYLGVARAWLVAGRQDRAAAALAPMLSAAGRVPWVSALAEGSLVAGRCALMRGDAAGARREFERARDLATRHGMAGIEQASRDLLADAADSGVTPDSR